MSVIRPHSEVLQRILFLPLKWSSWGWSCSSNIAVTVTLSPLCGPASDKVTMAPIAEDLNQGGLERGVMFSYLFERKSGKKIIFFEK